jgi:hypothetical protein
MRVGDSRNSRRVVVENEAALWVEKEGGGGEVTWIAEDGGKSLSGNHLLYSFV